MKKTLGLMLALIMVLAAAFTLAACGGGDDKPAEGAPAAPSLTVTVGDKTATLTWTAPSNTGDSAIIKYEVQRDKSGGGTWIDKGTALTHTFENLENGTTYTFKVRAVNTQGAGAVAEKTGKPTTGSTGGDTFEYGQNYIDQHLTGDYWIIYTITTYSTGDTQSATIEQRRVGSSYYLAVSEEGHDKSEQLFIKNGSDYEWYIKSSGTYQFMPLTLTESEVKDAMSTYLVYMTLYSSYDSFLQRDGSGTVAGRDCAKYTYNYALPGYAYSTKYSYWIDKATGICMKFAMDVQGGGEKAGIESECTTFQTTGVNLPSHN